MKNSATAADRGFDGKCVPKDTRLLHQLLDEESMIKILNMRGERDEVSKRTKEKILPRMKKSGIKSE